MWFVVVSAFRYLKNKIIFITTEDQRHVSTIQLFYKIFYYHFILKVTVMQKWILSKTAILTDLFLFNKESAEIRKLCPFKSDFIAIG